MSIPDKMGTDNESVEPQSKKSKTDDSSNTTENKAQGKVLLLLYLFWF